MASVASARHARSRLGAVPVHWIALQRLTPEGSAELVRSLLGENLPELEDLSQRRELNVREVRSVGADIRVIARVPRIADAAG